jgi:hypothetical protein
MKKDHLEGFDLVDPLAESAKKARAWSLTESEVDPKTVAAVSGVIAQLVQRDLGEGEELY